MPWDLTVAGVSQKSNIDQSRGVTIRLESNERSSMRFSTRWASNYIPARFAEVVAYAQDGVTPLFGGVVLTRNVEAVGTSSRYAEVTCSNFWVYLDWSTVTVSYTTDKTVAAVLGDIVAQLPASLGITLDATQAAGPTLTAPFSWEDMKASEAVREITRRTGWTGQLSPLKALKMSAPGGTSAPYLLTDGGPNCRMASWRDSARTPANRVVIHCGPSGTAATTTQQWIANGVATSWVTDIPAADPAPSLLTVDNGVTRYQATIGTGAQFTWDRDTHKIAVGTAPVPAAGTILTLGPTVAFPGASGFTGQYPFTIIAASGATPVITEVRSYPEITEYARGVETAAGVLAELDQQPRELSVMSLEHGWRPGQALTVNLSILALIATFTVGPVDIALTTDEWWKYQFTALESTIHQGSALDFWRERFGGSSGVAVITGSGGSSSPSTVLSSPAFLGGSRSTAITPNPAAWKPVPDYVTFTAPASFSGRIRVELKARNAAVSATARLYNITTAAAVATTSAVTATAFTEVTAVGAITAGHAYRLEVLTSGAGEGVFAIGNLEAA
ncbi:MAG TPA: hypothetical protein VNJ04_07220 [Gemmatimonadaceae bacterium]|nr:hypothetical protein [Gemmatimonadaceae bacterium]